MTTAKDLKTHLDSAGVKTCIASYVDMHGVSKSKFVPMTHFDQMMAGSEMFTGAALDGVPQEIHDEEVACMPDPGAAMILPWQTDVALIPSDLWCEGAPFEPCSRNILGRQVARAAEMAEGNARVCDHNRKQSRRSAIKFGDYELNPGGHRLNDAQDRADDYGIARLRQDNLNYGVLSEMNTKPRTTYLGRIRNPNPSLAGGQG